MRFSRVIACVAVLCACCFGCDGVTIGEPGFVAKKVIKHKVNKAVKKHVEKTLPCVGPYCPAPRVDRRRQEQYLRDLRASVSPAIFVPEEFRVHNYKGGSCVHASTANLLNHQGKYDLAKWWTENHAYGESASGLAAKMDAAGVDYALNLDSGPAGWAFLEKCCALRLGCGVGYPPGHCVNVYGIDATHVWIIDNNHPERYDIVTRAQFANGWGGWAFTVIGKPPPPEPRLPDAVKNPRHQAIPSPLSVCEAEEAKLSRDERECIEEINTLRKAANLPPVSADPKLMDGARAWAASMAERNRLVHASSGFMAENIAMGQNTAREVVMDWQDSRGHRRNQMGSYAKIGIGCAQAKNGQLYWCARFNFR